MMDERSPSGSLLDRLAREAPVAFLDLEMTGLDPQKDRVCEVAVIRANGPEVLAEYQALVHPGVKMTTSARKVHGISDEMLDRAPRFRMLAADVAELCADAVIVSHNVTHDLDFLLKEFEAAGVPFAPAAAVDTLLMSRRLFAFNKNNLHLVAEQLGVPTEGAHRALLDARITFAVWHRMLEVLDPRGVVTLRELAALIDALAPNSPLRLMQSRTLKDAFDHLQTVWIEYNSTDGQNHGSVRREIGIWRLKLPYIQAWCFLRDGERVFRLDRIRTVEKGERDYAIPQFQSRI